MTSLAYRQQQTKTKDKNTTMEKIRVDVQWCDKNFGASLGENVPGAVVVTAKTYEQLLNDVPESTLLTQPPCSMPLSLFCRLPPLAGSPVSTSISYPTTPTD